MCHFGPRYSRATIQGNHVRDFGTNSAAKLRQCSAQRIGTTNHCRQGVNMNWEQIKGNWNQAKGQAKQKWGELTDDDLTKIDGQREHLLGSLQEKYGTAKEKTEEQVEEFERACNC
jgi:uncharacterized protein YjbJ (UPF0337 family)